MFNESINQLAGSVMQDSCFCQAQRLWKVFMCRKQNQEKPHQNKNQNQQKSPKSQTQKNQPTA